MEIVLNDSKFKEILKEIIVELLKERSQELAEIISEALEDYLMGEAIKEGLETKNVSKEEVLRVLRS